MIKILIAEDHHNVIEGFFRRIGLNIQPCDISKRLREALPKKLDFTDN